MTTPKERIVGHLREIREVLATADVEHWAQEDIKILMFSIRTELRSLKES